MIRWAPGTARHWQYPRRFANSGRAENIARARQLLNVPETPRQADDTRAADDGEPSSSYPRPCCGGRMIILETFARGCTPDISQRGGSGSTVHDRRHFLVIPASRRYPRLAYEPAIAAHGPAAKFHCLAHSVQSVRVENRFTALVLPMTRHRRPVPAGALLKAPAHRST
jgi:hypothetical protein